MATPPWIIESHNEKRIGPVSFLTPPQAELVRNDGDAVWVSWDMEVKPGRYRLERLSQSSLFLDYFVCGVIPYPTQPEPIQIKDRLGELYSKSVTDMSKDPSPRLGGFYKAPNISAIEFVIPAGVIFRLESFASGMPNVFAPPGQPLPSGFTEWIDFHFITQRYDGIGDPVPGPSGWIRNTSATFGNTFATVSKRTLGNGDLSYIYSAEDGVDTDFNDLVVELTCLEH